MKTNETSLLEAWINSYDGLDGMDHDTVERVLNAVASSSDKDMAIRTYNPGIDGPTFSVPVFDASRVNIGVYSFDVEDITLLDTITYSNSGWSEELHDRKVFGWYTTHVEIYFTDFDELEKHEV